MEEIAQVMADLGILDIDGDGHEEFLVQTLSKMDMNNVRGPFCSCVHHFCPERVR